MFSFKSDPILEGLHCTGNKQEIMSGDSYCKTGAPPEKLFLSRVDPIFKGLHCTGSEQKVMKDDSKKHVDKLVHINNKTTIIVTENKTL